MRHKFANGIESGHPAIYPVTLPSHMIEAYTSGGDAVLDPFMGSGNNRRRLRQSGAPLFHRHYEDSRALFPDIACRRIEQAYKQPRIFEEPMPKASAGGA